MLIFLIFRFYLKPLSYITQKLTVERRNGSNTFDIETVEIKHAI